MAWAVGRTPASPARNVIGIPRNRDCDQSGTLIGFRRNPQSGSSLSLCRRTRPERYRTLVVANFNGYYDFG
jgi:hypothetical protein